MSTSGANNTGWTYQVKVGLFPLISDRWKKKCWKEEARERPAEKRRVFFGRTLLMSSSPQSDFRVVSGMWAWFTRSRCVGLQRRSTRFGPWLHQGAAGSDTRLSHTSVTRWQRCKMTWNADWCRVYCSVTQIRGHFLSFSPSNKKYFANDLIKCINVFSEMQIVIAFSKLVAQNDGHHKITSISKWLNITQKFLLWKQTGNH